MCKKNEGKTPGKENNEKAPSSTDVKEKTTETSMDKKGKDGFWGPEGTPEGFPKVNEPAKDSICLDMNKSGTVSSLFVVYIWLFGEKLHFPKKVFFLGQFSQQKLWNN